MDGDVRHGVMPVKSTRMHKLHIYLFEIYILIPMYFRQMYRDTNLVEALLLFYLGFALLLAFAHFRLQETFEAAPARVNALTLIRLSISVNTMPVFVTVFQQARREEIAGFGKDRIAFEPASVYFAKLIALSSFRVLLFIPFTAIVYPIIGLRGGFGHVLISFLTLAIQQVAAISIGLLVSAIFRDPNIAGVIISTVVLVTFLFSGSILLRMAVPVGLHWLEFLSISFYAHQALIANEFGGRQFKGGGSGDDFIKSQMLDVMGVWPVLGALILYATISNVIGPIALTLTSRPRHSNG